MTRVLATAVLFAFAFTSGACSSSDDAEPSNPLVGKWLGASSTSAGSCTPAFVFTDTVYEYDLICELRDGSFAVEVEVGNYTAAEGMVTLTPTAASCRVARNHAPGTFPYTVSGKTLRISSSSVTLALEKIADDPNAVGSGGSGGSAVTAQYGCVNDDAFVPSSIEQL